MQKLEPPRDQTGVIQAERMHLTELDHAYWVDLGSRLRKLNPTKFTALVKRLHYLVQHEAALADLGGGPSPVWDDPSQQEQS